MRVFIAGAAGAVGIRLAQLLAGSGHEVWGMTRSAAKAAAIEAAGASAVVADGLDAAAVRTAVEACTPEVIVHEMTALQNSDFKHFDRSFALTNRLRTEGLDHLLAAARAAGTRRIVAQSFCGWPYARTGGPVKTETDPLDPAPPRELRRTLEAIRYLERTVTGAADIAGVVLRYGGFYGPGTGTLEAGMLAQVRRRQVPLIGNGDGWWSFVQVDDAAAATAIAVAGGAPGIYNIVDDDPAPAREWLPGLAAAAGAKPPLRAPKWLARLAAGEHLVMMMTESRAGSNAKAKRELGWQPATPSWRQGWLRATRLGG